MQYAGLQIDLSNRESWVAIIGPRKPSKKESSVAYYLAKKLVEKGHIIVSGLAKGIDYYGHLGALHGKGKTIAIVNTPIFQPVYPEENRALANEIKKQGCILHPFETSADTFKNITVTGQILDPFKRRLIERNLLLAYLCPVICAVTDDSTIVGGTRYAVNYGKEHGKKVYRVDSKMKFHENPSAKKSEISWKMELDLVDLAM